MEKKRKIGCSHGLRKSPAYSENGPEITEVTKEYMQYKSGDVMARLRQAVQLFREENIIFAFAGTKSCSVLLHLISKLFSQIVTKGFRMKVIYAVPPNAFPEIPAFVDECASFYCIDIIKYDGTLKQAVQSLYEHNKHGAIIFGSRSVQPNCKNLRIMEPSEPGWPPLTRVYPLVDWSYHDIWSYIRINDVPYCQLYNKGYTSIGTIRDTALNPYLLHHALSGKFLHHAAYKLEDAELERAGRVLDPKKGRVKI